MVRARYTFGTEFPLSEGPDVISRGPTRSPAASAARSARCPGSPSMPRIVVTPWARNSASTSSTACRSEDGGTWACISARPGIRNCPSASMVAASPPAWSGSTIHPSRTTSEVGRPTEPAPTSTTRTLSNTTVWAASGAQNTAARASDADLENREEIERVMDEPFGMQSQYGSTYAGPEYLKAGQCKSVARASEAHPGKSRNL